MNQQLRVDSYNESPQKLLEFNIGQSVASIIFQISIQIDIQIKFHLKLDK